MLLLLSLNLSLRAGDLVLQRLFVLAQGVYFAVHVVALLLELHEVAFLLVDVLLHFVEGFEHLLKSLLELLDEGAPILL